MNPEVTYSYQMGELLFVTLKLKPGFNICSVNQVHGPDIYTTSTNGSEEINADGIISDKSSSLLAIKTADCLPIAYQGIKGFGLIHAGWRGLAQQILIHEKLKEIGPESILIGPCIRECCFEVSKDFKQNFPKSQNFKNKADKIFFDLPSEAVEMLEKSFPSTDIIDSKLCTMCNPNFHSYRRNKTELRNWNIYGAKDILEKNLNRS